MTDILSTPLLQAGQVEITNVTIAAMNGDVFQVEPQLDSIVLYEDMNANFMSGYIIMADTYDIPAALGRTGRDLLRLTIRTPGIDQKFWIDRVFIIYKMTNRTQVKDRLQGYKLHFASTELLISNMNTTSRAFKGTPSDIVKDIVTYDLKSDVPLIVDKTSNNIKYVSNFWTPTKNFTYLAEHAYNINKYSTYRFYENRDGFNFRALESIAQEPIIQDFHGNDFIADVNSDGNSMSFVMAKRDPGMSYKSVLGLRIEETYNASKDYSEGMIKTKLYSHDLLTKRLDINNYSMLDSKMTRMNAKMLYPADTVNLTQPALMNLNRHTDVTDNGDITNFKWLQQRVSDIRAYDSAKITIDVYGRTDYTCGRKTYVDFNRMMPLGPLDDANVYLDRMYSGYYIMTAVRHDINRDSHRCKIELSKPDINL